ncbi:MAG: cupin domain-containing protein [Pseudomonadota bacterium]
MRRPIAASELSPRTSTIYPEPFASTTKGRAKRALGDQFGLDQFGVNHTTLAPGSASALVHYHSCEDELVYVLSGTPTLETDEGKTLLRPGDVIGFKGGVSEGHRIINDSNAPATILEIGTRRPDVDEVDYPEVDLRYGTNSDPQAGRDGVPVRIFTRKDRTPL